MTSKRKRASRISLAAFTVAFSLAGVARADEPTPEQIATARALGTEGVMLAEDGDCARAVEKLARAEALYHAPTTLERLGECKIALGKFVEGTEMLQRVLRDTLPAKPPPAFVKAQERARKALDDALPKIAHVRVHVDAPASAQVSVTVDGVPLMSAMLDAARPTDPGEHRIEARASGFRPADAGVVLKPGEARDVTLKLEPDPEAQRRSDAARVEHVEASPPAPPPPPHETQVSSDARGGSNLLALSLLGVGAAGIVVGSVFGVMTLSTRSSLEEACVNKGCPASSQADMDALGTRATVSTIGFGVGLVGLGVGGVLLLTSSGGKSAALLPPARAGVRPWVGVAAAGVTGTFE